MFVSNSTSRKQVSMLRALKGHALTLGEDRAIGLADHSETNQTRLYDASALHLGRPLLFLP